MMVGTEDGAVLGLVEGEIDGLKVDGLFEGVEVGLIEGTVVGIAVGGMYEYTIAPLPPGCCTLPLVRPLRPICDKIDK